MGFEHQLNEERAFLFAGIPQTNQLFYHRVRFLVGDPAALIVLPRDKRHDASIKSLFILRDIEMHRAKQQARADRICCPKDFTPASGLSGDRETATAQAVAECFARHEVKEVVADRTLPLIFADCLRQRGIEVVCDIELGIVERRQKDEQEIEWLRQAQRITEGAMEMACRLVAGASAAADGSLQIDGVPLTSDRVRQMIDVWLLEQGFTNPSSIVAGGPAGADCHNLGNGVLKTEQPVIIDIFPRDRTTGYNGDCTRTVVHGEIPEPIQRMHAAVVRAKAAAESACKAGATGEEVHLATSQSIKGDGFEMGLPSDAEPTSYCGMVHGTGHGIGLDVHEPPLLDYGGPKLLVGDAVTIEPGLYSRDWGGVRVEDMGIVTATGITNLNQLPEGLHWN